eukprot:12790549-Heterocapsa_arctica.AAC.1
MSGLRIPSSPDLSQLSQADTFAVMMVRSSPSSAPDRFWLVIGSPGRCLAWCMGWGDFPCLRSLLFRPAGWLCGEVPVMACDGSLRGVSQELT